MKPPLTDGVPSHFESLLQENTKDSSHSIGPEVNAAWLRKPTNSEDSVWAGLKFCRYEAVFLRNLSWILLSQNCWTRPIYQGVLLLHILFKCRYRYIRCICIIQYICICYLYAYNKYVYDLWLKHSQFLVSSCVVPNLDRKWKMDIRYDHFPSQNFLKLSMWATASLLPHLGANTILLVPRSIKLTKTMGFPGQNQSKEHDRTCIMFEKASNLCHLSCR